MTAYPNPFGQSTTISFTILEPTLISLSVYDLLGTEVASLIINEQLQGTQEIEFNNTGLSKGIYFVMLQAGEHKLFKKLITAE
ncbi:MAG: T9SS type A sorting domain-containing protein [Bacteroidia bacterium]|nr:T9SS type A sorting domain-containing protein [Bacteroidia bacterium]